MNRWFTLITALIAASGIHARPQAPYINSPGSSIIIPIRRLVFLLRPNGQLIYLPGGLPSNLNASKQPTVSTHFSMPMAMPLPIPVAPGAPSESSVLPLALWPYLNQFHPSTISNGIYRLNATSMISSTLINPVGPTIDFTQEENKFPTSTSPSDVSPLVTKSSLSPVTMTQPSASSSVNSMSPPPEIISSEPNTESQSNGDYNFKYSVNDSETGDIKSHEEKRVDGIVTGYYMLVDADGTLRKVNYTADDQGFRATVSKLPLPKPNLQNKK